jgi:hypothetical protein
MGVAAENVPIATTADTTKPVEPVNAVNIKSLSPPRIESS